MNKISRRKFLGESTKVFAGTTAVMAGYNGFKEMSPDANRRVSPSDKVNVALIGSGGMGKSNLESFLLHPEVDCLAVADVDEKHLKQGIEKAAEKGGKRPQAYKDFREILERKDIDAVIVATPDHWHALATIYACQAGKDVYVEKPLATTIEEGRAMVKAARRYKRVVQVGTQQRSSEHFSDAVKFVKSGELGKMRMVRAWTYLDWKGDIGFPPDEAPPPHVDYDLWLGPAPKRPFNPVRFHHNFRWFWDYSGGLATDWGAHMIDVVRWALPDDPVGAMAIGGKYGFPNDIRETPDTQQSIIQFKNFSVLWEHMIGCGVGPWQREHGVEFHGENGLLVVDRGGWEVHSETDKFKQPGRVFRMKAIPRQGGSSGFHFTHVKNFVACIKSREKPVADVEIGHNSILACHLANIGVRLGRYIRWDARQEKVIGDTEAQNLVVSRYRKPWVLPKL